jgi:hypothetical protein
MTATGDQPVFHLDGSAYVATSLARGPWDPRACHGGAPAALVAAAVDATPSLEPMQGVRLTYDLVRPVPVGVPLHLDTEVVREGRRIQVVDVRLATAAEDVELVRCRALRIRTTSPGAAGGPAACPQPASRWHPRSCRAWTDRSVRTTRGSGPRWTSGWSAARSATRGPARGGSGCSRR